VKDWKLIGFINTVLAGVIAGITTLLGGWDDAMIILTVFIVLDIISGWVRAFIQKELSSAESFRGTARKVLIYVIVAVAAQADRLTGTALVRNVVITWYCATEALSIVENSVAAGLPVPEFLKQALKQLNEKKFSTDA